MSTDADQTQADTRIDYWYGRTIGYTEFYVAIRDLTTVAAMNGVRDHEEPTIANYAPFDLEAEYQLDESEVPVWAKEKIREYFYLQDNDISTLLERTDGGDRR